VNIIKWLFIDSRGDAKDEMIKKRYPQQAERVIKGTEIGVHSPIELKEYN